MATTVSFKPLPRWLCGVALFNAYDAVFGWKDDSLQKAMDANCNVNCPQLKTQSIAVGNKCAQNQKVDENVDGWLTELPGGMPVQQTGFTTINTWSLPSLLSAIANHHDNCKCVAFQDVVHSP